LEERIDYVIQLEKEAKKIDKRIIGVRKSYLSQTISEVSLSNSFGISYHYTTTHFNTLIATVAHDNGDSTIGYEFQGARTLSDINTKELVKHAVQKAVSLLHPEEFKTSNIPVILSPEASASLLSAFSEMFLGNSLIKKKTLLKDRLNSEIGSEALNIIDDGTLPQGLGTLPYDAEGFTPQKNMVVEKGIFKSFLHSLYTAKASGQRPTGNSVRDSYSSTPQAGITNFFIKRGDTPIEEMVEKTDKVLLVIELMGVHTADPVSGDFSFGASGVLYSNGKPVHPVRGVTIAGNILNLWNKIISVGRDLRFYGRVGSPSLLIESLTVGGS
jgi:PmbA protein